jgi:hypothetical protein
MTSKEELRPRAWGSKVGEVVKERLLKENYHTRYITAQSTDTLSHFSLVSASKVDFSVSLE